MRSLSLSLWRSIGNTKKKRRRGRKKWGRGENGIESAIRSGLRHHFFQFGVLSLLVTSTGGPSPTHAAAHRSGASDDERSLCCSGGEGGSGGEQQQKQQKQQQKQKHRPKHSPSLSSKPASVASASSASASTLLSWPHSPAQQAPTRELFDSRGRASQQQQQQQQRGSPALGRSQDVGPRRRRRTIERRRGRRRSPPSARGRRIREPALLRVRVVRVS